MHAITADPDASTSAAGRALTAKGRATRARIVSTASRLAFEKGVAGTTLDDIQTEARVKTSQLYHYFTDKDQLIHAVITHQAAEVLESHRLALADVHDVEGFARWSNTIISAVGARAGAGGCPVGSLVGALVEEDPTARAVLVDAFDKWSRLLSDALLRMQQRGNISPSADIDTEGLAILAALQGGLLISQTRRDADALVAALGMAVDHVRALAHTETPTSR